MITVKFTRSNKANWDALESTVLDSLDEYNYSIVQVYPNKHTLFILRFGKGNDQNKILNDIRSIPGISKAYFTPTRHLKGRP